MFAGTSAGGIVAGALAIGLTPESTSGIWTEEVSKIFTQGIYHRVHTVDNAFGCPYSATELERMLYSMVGDKTLKDLKAKFLAPAFRLDAIPGKTDNPRWQPIFFHNFPSSDNADSKLVEVILKTAAAPTYFPIRDGHVDGGTFANHPALCAVTTAIANGIKPEDITVFSISTGLNPKSISKDKIGDGNWGLVEWGPQIINLLLESTTQCTDYQMHCLLRDKYKRLDPMIPFDVQLDDASSVPKLVEVANNVDLTDTVKWLETNWGIKSNGCIPLAGLPMNPPSNPSSWGCSIQ
jgi:patatin-like phospholipase/acyl hydrolase